LFLRFYFSNLCSEWTAKQRQKFTQGRLSKERQQLLNTVGFVYRINKFIKRKSTAREDKKWWEQLERLIQFLLEHGHTLVPFQYAADKSLGRWVNEQRWYVGYPNSSVILYAL